MATIDHAAASMAALPVKTVLVETSTPLGSDTDETATPTSSPLSTARASTTPTSPASTQARAPTTPPTPTCTSSRPGRADIIERLIDRFDSRHVSAELLEALQDKESRSMRRITSATTPQASRLRLRSFILKRVQDLSGAANQGPACLVEAARIFDILPESFLNDLTAMSSAPSSTQAAQTQMWAMQSSVHTKAAALCKVAMALGAEEQFPRYCFCSLFAKASAKAGLPPLDPKELAHTEQEILVRLDSAPSVATWLRVFMDRLDVVMNGGWSSWRIGLEHITLRLVHAIVWTSPLSAERPPRTIALGCLALALVIMNLLPVDSVGLKASTAAERNQTQANLIGLGRTYRKVLEQQGIALPPQEALDKDLGPLALDIAADASREKIGAAASVVLDMVLDAMGAMRSPQASNVATARPGGCASDVQPAKQPEKLNLCAALAL